MKNHIIFLTLLLIMPINYSLCLATENNPTAIGKVTLVIGQVYANSQGKQRILQRDSALFIGDQVTTNNRSHVHIKFIDDGYVSVRPQSQLTIEAYQYDKENPEKSEIRFYLHQGVLRSISGKATEAAHSRYRMNTPIAALGVLGTDYVIKANNTQTWAAVYSGGIALAPFSQGCGSSGLGICANATKLTAEMGNKYLEVNRGDLKSQIKIQLDRIKYKLNEKQTSSPPVKTKESKEKKKDVTVKVESAPKVIVIKETINKDIVTQDPINNDLASNEKLGINPVIEPKPEVKPETHTPITAQIGAPIKQLEPSTLRWIRWPWQSQHTDDNVSQTKETVQEETEVTIGNDYVGLFRITNDLTQLQPQTGRYNFNLQNNHVVFVKSGQSLQNSEKATLKNSTLQMDFAARTFDTHLEMTNTQSESATLEVSGNISDKGIYTGQTINGHLSGALSLDGDNTALEFEKTIETGVFKGITEWTRQ